MSNLHRAYAVILTSAGFFLAGCDAGSPAKTKFEQSDLYEKGANCTKDFFALSDKEFIFTHNGQTTVLLKNVVLEDAGQNRLVMTSVGGSLKFLTTFVLSDDNRYASIYSVKTDHEFSKEEWLRAGMDKESFERGARQLTATPTMEMCNRRS
jgi:hypothetical protein